MIEIRNAGQGEFDQVGELLVTVYSSLSDFPSPAEQPDYYQELRNIEYWTTLPDVDVIVAVENGHVLGTVIYFADVQHYGSGGTITSYPNASGFRLLAVAPEARGRGIGKRITLECIRRARETGNEKLFIHSTRAMQTAWQLYERMGFQRFPDIDFMQKDLAVFGFQYFLTNRYFPAIAKNISTDLIENGRELNLISVDDLAPYDECHSRGRQATTELAELAGVNGNAKVLDVGCGIGGTCRFFANAFDCEMTGIEIDPSFAESATKLNELVGLDAKIQIHTQTALDLDSLEKEFDVVLSQHSTMNIQEKRLLLKQIADRLKPDGFYIYHEVFAANDSPDLAFPRPWSENEGQSHVISHTDFVAIAEATGLVLTKSLNRTNETREHFGHSQSKWKSASDKHPAQYFLGPKVKEKAAHYLDALNSNQLEVYMGQLAKPVES